MGMYIFEFLIGTTVFTLKSLEANVSNFFNFTSVYHISGDYATARLHLTRAREIDPDFCDIGYHEAILKVSQWE